MNAISWHKLLRDIDHLRDRIDTRKVWGIPRGGAIIAGMMMNPVDNIEDAEVIVDDIIDSGATLDKMRKLYPDKPFYALYDKREINNDSYIIFPWEVKEAKTEPEDLMRRLLQHLGQNTSREGLLDTPKRYLKFMREFLSPPEFNMTTFDSEGYDEMIIVRDIPFYSMCEHHLAPFFGTGAIAYIPDKKIVGISKLPRTLMKFASRLQNQERITTQVAEYLMDILHPKGVAVVLKARHMCMEMRGVKVHDTFTITSKMSGVFMQDDKARNEFNSLISDL